MKTRVPAWRQLRGKKDRPGSAAIIAQVNIGCRYREPLRKVYNRRIQHIAARRIEVTKPNRDRVLVFVASLKAIGTTAPTHTAAHLPDTTPTLPDQVALGKCIHGNKQEQEKQKICKSDYQNGEFCSVKQQSYCYRQNCSDWCKFLKAVPIIIISKMLKDSLLYMLK